MKLVKLISRFLHTSFYFVLEPKLELRSEHTVIESNTFVYAYGPVQVPTFAGVCQLPVLSTKGE
jgi:hypothetical protein